MKIIETKCPNCGAAMNYDADSKSVSCEFCGSSLIVDDETRQLRIDNAEELGYQFEKGRQRAQAESVVSNTSVQNNQPPSPKKRKTWLWVLGWIFIFPLPLTLILLKKPNMNKKVKYGIIIGAWVLYVLLGIAGLVNNKDDKNKNINSSTLQSTTGEQTTTNDTTVLHTTTPLTTVKPTTIQPTTIEPTVKENVRPTERITQPVTSIEFTNYTTSVEAGSNATVTIKGKPNTEYDIDVYYETSESKADGLENKFSDGEGYVTWEWKVGSKTTPGVHIIKVEGGGAKNSVSFEVF